MKKLRTFLRDTAIGGLLFLVPIFVLVEISRRIWDFFVGLEKNLVTALGFEELAGLASTSILTALLILFTCVGFGMLARWSFAKQARNWIDNRLDRFFPFYDYYRALMQQKIRPTDAPARPTVLVQRPGGWQPGIVVEEYASGEKVVFVPVSPKTTDGTVLLVKPEDVRPSILDEDALKAVLLAQGKGLIPN
jgi:uncharacterized membrane protein